jgi:hypothetical protein
MGFKDFVQNDIEKVFINSNEFAEVHNLNGTRCYAVAEGLTDKQHVEIMGQDIDGLIYDTIVVHVAKQDLPEVPEYNQIFRLNGRLMLVQSCEEDMGMLNIVLRGNNS